MNKTPSNNNPKDKNVKASTELTVREYFEQKRKARASDTAKIVPIMASMLKVSDYSQRKIRHKWAEKIVSEFNPVMLDPLVVSYRDGHYYVIDGQHRLYALQKLYGDKQLINCKVINGLTEKEEIKMFIDLNCARMALNYADLTKAKYYADDKVIVDLDKICKNNGFELGFEIGHRSKKDGRITCIQTLVNTYNKIGVSATERLVNLINYTWGDNADGLCADIIKAMALILSLYGKEMSDSRFANKLSKADPKEIIKKGKSDNITQANNTTKIARVMITNYYNKGSGIKLKPAKFDV